MEYVWDINAFRMIQSALKANITEAQFSQWLCNIKYIYKSRKHRDIKIYSRLEKWTV